MSILNFYSFCQKKSREESSGAGSGVEILINEPYVDGPGGKGQYTHKIYHIGSHLPGNKSSYYTHKNTRSPILTVTYQVMNHITYKTHTIYHIGSHLPGNKSSYYIQNTHNLPHQQPPTR